MDRYSAPTCKVFVRNIIVLFLALYHAFKSMEPLSSGSPEETDMVRRFLKFTKVFVATSAGD